MKGAIVFASKYGSTAQYAQWIGSATGLPLLDSRSSEIDLSRYDFLVIGTPIYYFKPLILSWIRQHLAELNSKTVILFTVSGAGAGAKLDAWIEKSFPKEFTAELQHFGLGGRMDPTRISIFHRTMLWIGSRFNSDPSARADELQGFDYMDEASLAPLIAAINRLQSMDEERSQEEGSEGLVIDRT